MSDDTKRLVPLFNQLGRFDKLNLVADMIRKELNDIFKDMITCNRVFVSRTNGSTPYYVAVIPKKPTKGILTTNFIKEYDIDIDLSSLGTISHDPHGLTIEEVIAWMMHEIYANVISDETLLRFKKLIVKYYNTKESVVLDAIDTFGIMLWIGIFSRTKKVKTDSEISEINKFLKDKGYDKDWNSALKKYILAVGNNVDFANEDELLIKDKIQLREFNKLARKYASYAIKYNDTKYSTGIKYFMESSNSELLKNYLMKEPISVPTIPEKMVFVLFDDNKLLMEAAVDTDVNPYDTIKAPDIIHKQEELVSNIGSMQTEADKLLVSAKVKELGNVIEDKIEKSDIDSSNLYNNLKLDNDKIAKKVEELHTPQKVSVQDIE